MALRNQPYLPLYIQDVLTDEKLIECSASSQGVYFRLLCILHKQEKYGLICLKQKYKQIGNRFKNFAVMLSKQMPFDSSLISDSLIELSEEGVIIINDNELLQKRMVKDGELSLIRSKIGKTGGSSVTKQYGREGYLYLMSDGYEKHKVGISVNPKNRLYRLRSDLKLPKNFDIIEIISVQDMGKSEDAIQLFLGEKMDGEWVISDYQSMLKSFALFKAKIQAKSEAKSESESVNEYDNESLNKIVKIYNDVCQDLPKCQKLTDQRKKTLKARMQDYSLSQIGEVIQNTADSKFLNGNNDKGWKASFDWIINPSNFIKILEGNYSNSKDNKNGQSTTENAFREVAADIEREMREHNSKAE